MPPVSSIQSGLTRGSRRQQQKWRASTIRCLLLTVVLFTILLWLTLAIFGLGGDDGESEAGAEAASSSSAAAAAKPESSASSLAAPAPKAKATIAYAVSLTSCGSTTDRHDNVKNGGHSSDPSFHEGAAVLKHSIHLSSIRNYHVSKSVFDYEVSATIMTVRAVIGEDWGLGKNPRTLTFVDVRLQ